MDIRKISVGPDYKSGAMHYIVGQEVLNGSYAIHVIKYYEETQSIKIWIEQDSEVILWKEFTGSMPISIEYNINFLMKSIYQFIVEPKNKRRYDNIKNIGGIDFITSSSEEDVDGSNRQAIVLETPLEYTGPIKKGDTLLVHHNVFKFYNDMKGRRKSGKSFLKENIFFLDADQFFAYKKGDTWMGYN